MTKIKMTLNVLLSLIIDSKKTGSGKIGNGRLLVKLLQVITDNKGGERTHERNLLACFNDDVNKQDSYHKIDKKIGRFLPQGHYYPYEKLSFTELENCIGNSEKIVIYLRKMQFACDEIIDFAKVDSLVYTILQIIRMDNSISRILYGSEFIPKDKLFGSYANPKRICIEALLLGLLYHVHKNPDDAEKRKLLEVPARRKFLAVSFDDENSLDLELPIGLIENICDGAKHQISADIKYTPELRHENEIITKLPDNGNIFLYGVGGSGKSTLLLNQIRNENTVNFYFPLYQYRQEIHEKIRSRNCWILLNILLKYHYQYEYQTYEACAVCEGEDTLLRQMAILDRELKADPDNIRQKYVLLLDGMNEIQLELRETLVNELTWINKEWKNVRIILSGGTVPLYELFNRFSQIESCGIQTSEVKAVVSKIESEYDLINDDDLLEVLKIPKFLEIFLDSHQNENELNKSGEIIDSYIMNWKSNLLESDTIRFIVQFALPLLCKRMHECNNINKTTRQAMLDAIDHAIKIYILNERTYQTMTAPRNIRKNLIIEKREKNDLVEMLLNNAAFMKEDDSKSGTLYFVHDYYRDYFAAKHILNAIEALNIGFKSRSEEENNEYFEQLEIKDRWFNGSVDFSNNYNAFRMIGEISGDYKNVDLEYRWYKKTLLDKFLDLNRGKKDSCAANNIIRTMWVSRDQVIQDVDFSNLVFRWYLPTYAKFSLNGKYACDFNTSYLFHISLFEFDSNSIYAVSGDLMLIVFEYCANVVLWNVKERKIVKEYNILKIISKYTYERYLDCVEISHDQKYFDLLLCTVMIEFELETGKFVRKVGIGDKDEEEYLELSDRYINARDSDSIKPLDPVLLEEIVSQMDIFRECDFRDVLFADKREKEMLHKMGALCSMNEDNFMDENAGWEKELGTMYWWYNE